ncbi:RING finger protein [Endozoicomonas sp. 8E]|uniref:RING finger protein n=1 Tax=Endozoicomonas sp. 8E TaxID=3035692 RepID=UPI002938F88C|nr:RING-HC finger protein [Endozoicomonas sp. 8E]WOG29213.1 RING-HC finger protein [Endozoicomonas sp. 8E]
MAITCVLKTLLFSVLLFFYQQGLANDTYRLEKFRKYQMKNWKPLSKEQQNCTDQLEISSLENIRLGFVRLNLESDDLSGDGRLETCETYEVYEKDFNRLNNFYFNYVNRGNPERRKVRIQRVLRLIHRIFAINLNRFNDQSRGEKELIDAMAKSLFDQLFLSVNINGRSNPYFNYFHLVQGGKQCNYVGVNNGLVLMFLAFLAPHFLSRDRLYTYFCILGNIYTGESCDQAFDRALLSENINAYDCPQCLSDQLKAAELDTGIALLIGLTAMASAAFQRIDSGLESQETLENLLIRCLPYELLPIVYSNAARHCRPGRSCPVPAFMYTVNGMQEFTSSIMGINPAPLTEASSFESLKFLMDYIELSDSVGSDSEFASEESDSEDQDQSIVVRQQNELIGQLRQELANQPITEEAGAVRGVSAGTKKCPICTDSLTDVAVLHRCGHAGFCKTCAERLINEQRECPFCREIPLSYMKVIDMSLP